MKTTLSLALSLFICTTAYSQNTWIVDQSGAGDFTEIQLAIDSLSVADGDEVIVKDGTYFEHINFNQKEILLRSENGAATTIIDGGGSGDVVSIINGEQAPTELRGFTVTNGNRGINCFNYSEVIIDNCIISNHGGSGGLKIDYFCTISMTNCEVNSNTNSDTGGGIDLRQSTLFLDGCSIDDNESTAGGSRYGGGIFASDSAITANECLFSSNRVTYSGNGSSMYGGGVYLIQSTANFTDTDFFNNSCSVHSNYSAGSSAGGAIYFGSGNLEITRCNFSENYSYKTYGPSNGGAIYIYSADNLLVSDSVFTNNSTNTGSGGAIYSTVNSTLTNCLFTGNTAPDAASAIDSPGTFTNLTVISNAANYAITGAATLTNSIIRGTSPLPNCPTTYSCIEGGKSGIGNFSVDPMFEAGPQGDYYLSQISSGQVADSPCIDSGDPNSPLIIGTTRTDELNDTGIVDMGYHYNGDNYDPNNAPAAVNDTASTVANSDVVISVLLNDSDADGDTLSVVSVTTPLNGTATLNGDDVTYSPLLDWSGVDTFTYDVSDSNGGVSTATVTVTVDAAPTLNITPIVAGGIVHVTITGSAPRGTFILCWSFNGPGPTTIGGTNLNLSLSPPIRTAAPFMLDANGDGAMNPVNVPNWLTPGTGMWFQGAVIDIAGGSGVTLSNALDMVVQ